MEKATINTYLLYIISLDLVPLEQVLANTGLSLEQVHSNKLISFLAFSTAVENVGRSSADPVWGAALGAKLGATSHGVIGFAALTAPTVGKAISTFIEWEQIRVNTYDYDFDVVEVDHPVMGRIEMQEISISDSTNHDYYHFIFFQAFAKIIESIMVEILSYCNDSTLQFNFNWPEQGCRETLKSCYCSLLSFEPGLNKILVPRRIWQTQSPNYDNDSYSLNLAKCLELSSTLERQSRPDFVVKNLIKSQLERNISRQLWPDPIPSLSEISALTYTSERTLIRRLARLKTSYQEIVEAVRKDYALRLLADAKFSLGEISDVLAYQSPANFSRAFKSWYGVSPSKYRRQP